MREYFAASVLKTVSVFCQYIKQEHSRRLTAAVISGINCVFMVYEQTVCKIRSSV